MELTTLLDKWTTATSELKWGVNRAFKNVFEAAEQGQTTLIYGRDYRDGSPCLVNTVGTMLTVGGGTGIPSTHFGEVVSLFDQINAAFHDNGVNPEQGVVTPLAAEILLKYFGKVEIPELLPLTDKDVPYIEPSDKEMADAIADMFAIDSPCNIAVDENDVTNIEVSPIDSDR